MTSNKIDGLYQWYKTDRYKQPQPQSQPLAIDGTTGETAEEGEKALITQAFYTP